MNVALLTIEGEQTKLKMVFGTPVGLVDSSGFYFSCGLKGHIYCLKFDRGEETLATARDAFIRESIE